MDLMMHVAVAYRYLMLHVVKSSRFEDGTGSKLQPRSTTLKNHQTAPKVMVLLMGVKNDGFSKFWEMRRQAATQ
jgi:hypothetical protein